MDPSLTDWIVAIAGCVSALGISVAALTYVVSRRQLRLDQLDAALAMRRRWEDTFVDRQKGLAVMTWFVFPRKDESVGIRTFLPTEEDWELSRQAALNLAYHTHGPIAEYEAATRRLYQFLYELACLRDTGLLTTELVYTFFGRELIRHWSAIRGFVLHWPPSENFPQQQSAIDDLLIDLHSERMRRRDLSEDTARRIASGAMRHDPPNISALLDEAWGLEDDE